MHSAGEGQLRLTGTQVAADSPCWPSRNAFGHDTKTREGQSFDLRQAFCDFAFSVTLHASWEAGDVPCLNLYSPNKDSRRRNLITSGRLVQKLVARVTKRKQPLAAFESRLQRGSRDAARISPYAAPQARRRVRLQRPAVRAVRVWVSRDRTSERVCDVGERISWSFSRAGRFTVYFLI